MQGFTGIVWEAREPERLARDLHHGPGPKPLFEAGMSWAQIAGVLTDLHHELAVVIRNLSDSWRGKGDNEMISALTKVSSWLTETADMAKDNAVAAERQAVANAVARTAMPDPAEITALNKLEESLHHLAFPAGSALAGGMAKVESSMRQTTAQAARVMESYETATTPVSHPWEPVSAPEKLVHSHIARQEKAKTDRAALPGEQAAADVPGTQALMAGLAAMMASPMGMVEERVLTARQSTLRLQTATTGVSQPAAVAEVDEVVQTTQAVPLVPPAPVASVSNQAHSVASDLHLATRAETTQVVSDGESRVAPAVLGAPDKTTAAPPSRDPAEGGR